MQIFANPDYRLSRFPTGAKVFYSLFLVFVLLGLLTSLGFIFAKSGVSAATVAEYYRQEDSGLGPKSFLELLETAHFHLFSMPIFFLVLGHIFVLTSVSPRWKMIVVVTAFVALLLEVALPWLIVYGSAGFAWLEHPTRLAFFGTFVVMAVLPLLEMWSPPSGSVSSSVD
ncbi:MAG: hypothetical protein ACREQJ_01705 [Candidatus Binatia bacterium]